MNSLHWTDPTNTTVAVLSNRLQASFRVNQNMAVGPWMQVDTDVNTAKSTPAVAGGGMLSFTFGDSGRKPADSKTSAE